MRACLPACVRACVRACLPACLSVYLSVGLCVAYTVTGAGTIAATGDSLDEEQGVAAEAAASSEKGWVPAVYSSNVWVYEWPRSTSENTRSAAVDSGSDVLTPNKSLCLGSHLTFNRCRHLFV